MLYTKMSDYCSITLDRLSITHFITHHYNDSVHLDLSLTKDSHVGLIISSQNLEQTRMCTHGGIGGHFPLQFS